MGDVLKGQVITPEKVDRLVVMAAKAAGYEEGFGVMGYDLGGASGWAAYIRQSREEQAQNNRIPEYLLTAARMARENGVIVPREYIVIDHESSEYLDRKNMLFLRTELIAKRRIAGVIITHQGRLTADPLHQMLFERECSYYSIRLLFGDAPSGTDWASTAGRQFMAQANWLRVTTTREGAWAGNIGRVLKGMVPAHKAAYGYRYCRDAEITQDGKVRVKAAWWEVDKLGPDGAPLRGSPAWVVDQIFSWVALEGRTLYWVCQELNEMGVSAPEGRRWSLARVANIVHHACYTGNHAYNVNARVPNPARPLGDITAQIKRTLLQPKPENEWVRYSVPALVAEEVWRKANAAATERGRGRGKRGKSIQALLRSRIFCPKCGKPMVVRRDGRQNRVYYHCSKYFRSWVDNPCNYSKFIPGTWDDLVWGDICCLLRDDSWVEQQVASEQSRDENTTKLMRLQQYKVAQARAKMAKVREGYEGGIYSLEEAKRRIAEHQDAIAKAEGEILMLQEKMVAPVPNTADLEALKSNLKALRDRNLDEASFEGKLDIIALLGIKVYPSGDLKSMKVICQLDQLQQKPDNDITTPNLDRSQANGECESQAECRKVLLAPLTGIRTHQGGGRDCRG